MEHQKVLYPLTNAQIRIWETEQFYKDTSIANIGGALFLKEKIDFDIWEQCINKLIERNDSLRIRILKTNNGPKQFIETYKYQKLEHVDFTGKLRKEQDTWLTNRLQIPFDVYGESLYTFISIKAWDGWNGGFLKFHHMLGDGWTIGLLSTQIMEEYARRKGKANGADSIQYSYLDYIQSELEYINSAKYEKDRQYWFEKFKNKPALVSIKPKNGFYYSSEAKRMTYTIEAKEAGMIRDYCTAFSTSPAILFEAALGIYLKRLNDVNSITLGVPVLNRRGIKELSTVGMYVSTIPIQIVLDDNVSFSELCRQIGKEHFQCFRHQRYPYNRMLAGIRELHGIHDNLYDVSVSYQNTKINKSKHSFDFKTVWYFNGHQTESFCLHIDDRDDAGIFVLHVDYLRELFNEDEIAEIYKRIKLILMQAIIDGSRKISDIELVDDRERYKLLYKFNDTKADYPKDKLIHQLFEEQVVKTPDHIALVFGEGKLTYRELNCRANGVARVLREKGVRPDSIVGMMTERSVEMIVGIIAILKAGGAYLPIDPEYPEERIGYMLEDSKAEVLLTQRPLKGRIAYQGEVIDLSSEELFFGSREDITPGNLENVISPEDLAYVIYTSGSTGRPKGVLVEHRNVLAYVNAFNKEFNVTGEDAVLQQASYSFDAFVEEMYPVLLKGGRLVLASREEVRDVNLLEAVINRNSISVISCSPFVLNHLNTLPGLKSVHTFISGGDVLKGEYIDNLLLRGAQVYNTYGPTEATVCASYYKCLPDNRALVPIGKPIANYRIYILDPGNNLLPVNIPGELCIAGDGVSRGYLNRPELTAEKFVENPFVPGERIYRTGDLARWLPDGNIEFLGRIDNQVKIRGFRVELGEVEARLLKLDGVKEAVVMAREDNTGSKYLCAYLAGDREVVVLELRKHLAQELPDYMIPSYFLQLENLPLTPNGKIDRQALPEPEGKINTGAEYIPPSSDTEIRLARLWQEVLGVDRIGINDNFFELGGHSLKATVLVSKVQREFGINIPLVKLFSEGTIAMLADCIDAVKPDVKKSDVCHIPDQKLVLLKTMEGARENLFLIHDGSCTVEGYVEFSHRLELDANVWGIKAAEADDVILKDITIADLAGDYVKTIKTIQPKGPYSIAGWSTGGVLAFEIALQLERAGDTIRFVSMIDSPPPINEDSGRELKELEEMWGELEEQLEEYLEGVAKAEGRARNGIPEVVFKLISDYRTLNSKDRTNMLKVIKAVLSAESRYQPTAKLHAELVYIGARDSKDIDNHKWSGYCEKPVRYVEVKGDHFSIFKSPDVIGLTKAFAQIFPKILALK